MPAFNVASIRGMMDDVSFRFSMHRKLDTDFVVALFR